MNGHKMYVFHNYENILLTVNLSKLGTMIMFEILTEFNIYQNLNKYFYPTAEKGND